jgi:hypothetical protein
MLFNRIFLLSIFLISLSSADSCDFAIARIKYDGGGDWYSDPTSLVNLIAAIKERTRISICPEEKKLEIGDPDLYSYPILFMTGHGNVRLSESEVDRLREYLLNGGFLFVDDCFGIDESLRREMKRVFPELSFVEIPFSYPVYHSFYNFKEGLPKIHKHNGGPPQGLALLNKGRVMVFYSFNTDLGDGWEDTEVHNDPEELHEAALRMGINVITYALSR